MKETERGIRTGAGMGVGIQTERGMGIRTGTGLSSWSTVSPKSLSEAHQKGIRHVTLRAQKLILKLM
jgi:cobalamin biosynthesis protein CbiD